MKKLFSFGSKAVDRLNAKKFVFGFTVHSLAPWPHGNRAIAVGWQRGKEKRGATRSVYPSTAPGRMGAVIRINERFEVPASLYKSGGAYKKKCIILAILETDGRTQATAALGRVVIDLAEFASAASDNETRTFHVSCNKQIHQAVGEPQLTVTVRCRPSNVAMDYTDDIDDGASHSTDTAGSRMTNNLMSFMRFKPSFGRSRSGDEAPDEQDLGGFEAVAAEVKAKAQAQAVGMGTIAEGPEEHGHAHAPPPERRVSAGGGSRGRQAGAAAAGAALAAGARALGSGGDGTSGRGEYPGSERPSGSGSYARGASSRDGPFAPASLLPPPLSPGGGASNLRSPAGSLTPNGSLRGPLGGEREGGPGGLAPSRSLGGSLGGSESDLVPSSAVHELLNAAAGEVAVHLAGVARAKHPQRNVHAPARRVARTLVCLGPGDGRAFGRQIVQLIEVQLSSLRTQVIALQPGSSGAAGPSIPASPPGPSALEASTLSMLFFWWSNCVQLRGLLQALAGPEYVAASTTGMRWAADAVVPLLLPLERYGFEALLQHSWATLLAYCRPVAAAAAGAAPGRGGQVPSIKRSGQEAAIRGWLAGLEALQLRLRALGPHGHLQLLREQVLQQCLKRLDALLFHYLVTTSGSNDGADLLQDYAPDSSLWFRSPLAGKESAVPEIDDACLPFSRGALSFGNGMVVKMTVTRLQQWAGQQGVSRSSAKGAEGVSTQHFPLLRAVADLLMMPKDLLIEEAVWRDVTQWLSIRSMLHILERFASDEFAADGISSELIDMLTAEREARGSTRPRLSDLSVGYIPAGEEAIFGKQGDRDVTEPGLEYDVESEGELEEMGVLVGGPAGVPLRVRMLHQLWMRGAPRRRESRRGTVETV
ncbi:hypothetical protein FOA52_014287 [Chlamydomonas sp. UWO 241]|nr:hypothetical protein FOA52_014287 [Chlamydomonas sp. UWO 241]